MCYNKSSTKLNTGGLPFIPEEDWNKLRDDFENSSQNFLLASRAFVR